MHIVLKWISPWLCPNTRFLLDSAFVGIYGNECRAHSHTWGRTCTVAKTSVLFKLFQRGSVLSFSLHLLSTSFSICFSIPFPLSPLSSHFSPLSPLSVSPSVLQTTWHSSKMWLKRMIGFLRSLFPSSLPLSVPFFLSLSFFLTCCYGLKQWKNVDCNATEDC